MWTYTQTNELYHYGVQGMKWGVRRSREVKSVNKQYKKELSALKKDKKSKNESAYINYRSTRDYIGEIRSSSKYFKEKSKNEKDYESKKNDLQKKYEPQFKKAQSKAEKRINNEKISKLNTSKKTSTGKKVAAGVLAGLGATYVTATTIKTFKDLKTEMGVSVKDWVGLMVAARK